MINDKILKAAAFWVELRRQIPPGTNPVMSFRVGDCLFDVDIRTDPGIDHIILEAKKLVEAKN